MTQSALFAASHMPTANPGRRGSSVWAARNGLITLARLVTHTTFVTIAIRTPTNRANAEGHWWRVR